MDCKDELIEITPFGAITRHNALEVLGSIIANVGKIIFTDDVYIITTKETSDLFWSLMAENDVSIEILERIRVSLKFKGCLLKVSKLNIDTGFEDIMILKEY